MCGTKIAPGALLPLSLSLEVLQRASIRVYRWAVETKEALDVLE
jgi:hypothetical protein